MEIPVERGERLWSGDGLVLYATDHAGQQIMAWDDAATYQAALRLNDLLKRHALATNLLEVLDGQAMLVRELQPFNLTVTAEASLGDSSVVFSGPNGRLDTIDEVLAIAGVNKRRVEMMGDAAAHAARSLRAHLSPHGVERLRLTLTFGVTHDAACLLQVVNPAVCDLGTTDMEGLANLLGG